MYRTGLQLPEHLVRDLMGLNRCLQGWFRDFMTVTMLLTSTARYERNVSVYTKHPPFWGGGALLRSKGWNLCSLKTYRLRKFAMETGLLFISNSWLFRSCGTAVPRLCGRFLLFAMRCYGRMWISLQVSSDPVLSKNIDTFCCSLRISISCSPIY